MNSNQKTVSEYAELCGLGIAAIYARINRGEIKPDKIKIFGYNTKVIDIKKYPPSKKERRGRKKLVN